MGRLKEYPRQKGEETMSIRMFVFVAILGLFTGAVAMADSGVPFVGSVSQPTAEEASIFVLPDGSGPPLTEAMGFGGHTVDASISVILIDIDGYAICCFPWEDIWLEAETATAFACLGLTNGGFRCDTNTTVDGETYFATSLAGGGWSEGPMWVYLNGERAWHPDSGERTPVPLRFNSADITGDGRVNLADVSRFAVDYHSGYSYRSDFHWDGVLNISDVSRLAVSMGAGCE
jgi:hypothetical protein